MAGSGNEHPDDEFVQAVPPVDLNAPPDEPSGPIVQVVEGLSDAVVEGAMGTVQLIVETGKMIHDAATTKEGRQAAFETTLSMMKDAAALSGAPVPKAWQEDVYKRLWEWTKDSATQLKKDWEQADAKGEEVRFISKKIGWAVIALIAKRVAPKACVKCASKRKKTTNDTPESDPQLPKDMNDGLAIEKARQKLPASLAEKYDITPGDPNQPILFGQKGASPTFGSKGKFKGADFDDVVQKLIDGDLTPNDFPIQYHWVNGQKVVVNNRSLAALTKANKKPTNTIDMTGKLPPDGPDSLPSVLNRLEEMDGKPSRSLPIRSDPDDWNSPPKETVEIPE